MSENAAAVEKDNFIINYFKEFRVLKEVRKEYWFLQLINMLDMTAYFAMFNVIILSLSSDFGFNDLDAGYVFMLFSSTTTICLFFSGLITDWFGIKKALYTAIFGLLITRFGVVFAATLPESTTRDVIVIVAMFLMAPFMAMISTTFQAANKRFTTKKSRGAGFNLWYLFMNVGAMAGGFLVDIFFLTFELPRYHIFTLGVVMSLICVVATFFGIKNTEQAKGEEEEVEEQEEAGAGEKGFAKLIAIVKAVGSEPVFWRFTALITLLLGVRTVFFYLGLLHPKFWVRVIGPDAQIGALQAFNPILVIIGLIVLIPFLNRFHIFKMLIGGAIITSISMFIIAIPYSPFAGTGIDIVTFTYATSIGFLLVLTIGELIWSPRLQEYTAAIAPKGQEGTYLGLSMVPYFLAKTAISAISGHMLARWCPEFPEGEPILGERIAAGQIPFTDSPYMMFTILAVFALAGTVIAWMLRGWFTKGMDEQAPAESEA